MRLAILSLASCVAIVWVGSSWAWTERQQEMLDRPAPTTPEAVQAECGELRDMMQRQQTIVSAAAAQGAANQQLIVALARSNAAAFRTRAANIGCAGAFQGTAPAPTAMTFDQCFAKCKQLTSRDDAACFDACKR